MMIFDRQKQRLLLEGKEYTPGDIHSLVAEGEGNHPSAIWDLYLFLNEWFNVRGEKRNVSICGRPEND